MKKSTKKNLKLIGLIAVLLVIIYVILEYVGVPIPVKREVIASQVVIGENTITPVEVEIDGWMRIYLGKGNRFEGTFEIEGHNETLDKEAYITGSGNMYGLYYKTAGISSFGLVLSDSMFWRDFAVQIADGVIFADGKTAILYPQVTADTVEERITEIRREVGWSEQLLEEETQGE